MPCCVYVITSNGIDTHADMALVSMLSLRISNAGLRILAVCDSQTAKAVRASGHEFLNVCDELLEVNTPEGAPVFRNRWIKTQLGRFIDGDFLFLDADTLVRRPLSDLPALVGGFGGVRNHNGAAFSDQIWDEDREYLIQMGWGQDLDEYINGGVWYVRKSAASDVFFRTWHQLWLEGVEANGRWRDQPSLNTALRRSGIERTLLPALYNAQVRYNWAVARDAHVWHFFHSMDLSDTCFPALLSSCGRIPHDRLRRAVRRAIWMREPWPNQDFLARRIMSKGGQPPGGRRDVAAELWLLNRRYDALRYAGGAMKRALLRGRVS